MAPRPDLRRPSPRAVRAARVGTVVFGAASGLVGALLLVRIGMGTEVPTHAYTMEPAVWLISGGLAMGLLVTSPGPIVPYVGVVTALLSIIVGVAARGPAGLPWGLACVVPLLLSSACAAIQARGRS